MVITEQTGNVKHLDISSRPGGCLAAMAASAQQWALQMSPSFRRRGVGLPAMTVSTSMSAATTPACARASPARRPSRRTAAAMFVDAQSSACRKARPANDGSGRDRGHGQQDVDFEECRQLSLKQM